MKERNQESTFQLWHLWWLWVFRVLGDRREDENQDIMKDDLCDTGLSAVLVWMFFRHWVCVYVGVHLAHNSPLPLLIHIIYFLLFIKTLLFLGQFYVHSKIEGQVQRFHHILTGHTCTACAPPPIINIPHQSGTFVTTDEPTLTHHNHPKSIVYIRVHSW